MTERPGTPAAVLLWMIVCVVLIGLIVVIIQGCAAGPKEAPLSRLAGANPNCIRNCSANYLTIDGKTQGPFNPVVTGGAVTATTTTTEQGRL